MYAFELLESGCYYLIQEKENDPICLIKINMSTDHCLYVSYYGMEEEIKWKKKSDIIFDIIELLSDEAVRSWESSYNNNAFNYEEDEE
jgi:hypothetical protein